MRVYLETIEQGDIETEKEYIRLDVTDKTEQEQADILTSFKDFMTGLTCVFTRHYCYHDENKPCMAEIV